MNFAIYAGKPYAVKHGEFYPCTVTPTGYSTGNTPVKVDAKGCHTEIEIRAKLGAYDKEVTSMTAQAEIPTKPKGKTKK